MIYNSMYRNKGGLGVADRGPIVDQMAAWCLLKKRGFGISLTSSQVNSKHMGGPGSIS